MTRLRSMLRCAHRVRRDGPSPGAIRLLRRRPGVAHRGVVRIRPLAATPGEVFLGVLASSAVALLLVIMGLILPLTQGKEAAEPSPSSSGRPMPFTPFHFGVGLAVKSAIPGRFHLGFFVVLQVIIDLESLYNLVHTLPRPPIPSHVRRCHAAGRRVVGRRDADRALVAEASPGVASTVRMYASLLATALFALLEPRRPRRHHAQGCPTVLADDGWEAVASRDRRRPTPPDLRGTRADRRLYPCVCGSRRRTWNLLVLVAVISLRAKDRSAAPRHPSGLAERGPLRG